MNFMACPIFARKRASDSYTTAITSTKVDARQALESFSIYYKILS